MKLMAEQKKQLSQKEKMTPADCGARNGRKQKIQNPSGESQANSRSESVPEIVGTFNQFWVRFRMIWPGMSRIRDYISDIREGENFQRLSFGEPQQRLTTPYEAVMSVRNAKGILSKYRSTLGLPRDLPVLCVLSAGALALEQ
jgi:hypothetical protein